MAERCKFCNRELTVFFEQDKKCLNCSIVSPQTRSRIKNKRIAKEKGE